MTVAKAKGIADIGVAFEGFCEQLVRTRSRDVDSINIYGSGFEGWLKFEFIFYLANAHGLVPREDIGVECSVSLRWPGERKRCDLWIADSSGVRYHYVELKAFFRNSSESKMRGQARSDLWNMVNIDPDDQETSVATGNVITVGVGFVKENWNTTDPMVQALEGPQGIPIATRSGSLSDVVQWNVWTRAYARAGVVPETIL